MGHVSILLDEMGINPVEHNFISLYISLYTNQWFRQEMTCTYMCGCFLSLHQGTPMHVAAREGNMEALKHQTIGSDVNCKDDEGVSI